MTIHFLRMVRFHIGDIPDGVGYERPLRIKFPEVRWILPKRIAARFAGLVTLPTRVPLAWIELRHSDGVEVKGVII